VKVVRHSLCALAAVALIAGCGKGTSPTSVTPESGAPTLDTSPPPVPAGFNVIDDPSGQVSLVWDESSAADVVGYEIFSYAPNPESEESFALQYTTDATTRQFNVDASPTYVTRYFRIRAVDAAGNRSPLTPTLSVTTGPLSPTSGGPEDPGLPTMNP
jgi:hypothetical protein